MNKTKYGSQIVTAATNRYNAASGKMKNVTASVKGKVKNMTPTVKNTTAYKKFNNNTYV